MIVKFCSQEVKNAILVYRSSCWFDPRGHPHIFLIKIELIWHSNKNTHIATITLSTWLRTGYDLGLTRCRSWTSDESYIAGMCKT